MSSKRMLGLAVFGVLFIVLFIGIMLLSSYLGSGAGELELPDTEASSASGGDPAESAPLRRVEITIDNVQDVIRTLSRPESYTRDVNIESYWDGSSAVYKIEAAVSGGITALRSSGGGIVKWIIVTSDTLYTWNDGDSVPFVRKLDDGTDRQNESDGWQMLPTYEDVLKLPQNAIIDADYVEYGGEDCIYVTCKSGRLGYTTKYYISVSLGLLTGAEEYDSSQTPAITYKMTTGEISVEEPDSSAFLLPDGSNVTSSDL